jgi:hypothetical protein
MLVVVVVDVEELVFAVGSGSVVVAVVVDDDDVRLGWVPGWMVMRVRMGTGDPLRVRSHRFPARGCMRADEMKQGGVAELVYRLLEWVGSVSFCLLVVHRFPGQCLAVEVVGGDGIVEVVVAVVQF